MRPTALAAAALAAGISGCTITQSVDPVAAEGIERVCLRTNPDVLMGGFEPALVDMIERRGIPVEVYRELPEEGCPTIVVYTANWRWDLAMYLHYARIEVWHEGRPVGSAEYDARMGGGNMGKFGPTEAKLAPLVAQLFPPGTLVSPPSDGSASDAAS